MRISRSVGYGLLAVGFIGQQKDKSIVLSNAISEKYKIPLEYLLKIMQSLVRANILHSKRGPRGGFSLARPLTKITMLDVIEGVEGPLDISLNLDEHAPKDKFAKKTEAAYGKVIAGTRAEYNKVKMSDLV